MSTGYASESADSVSQQAAPVLALPPNFPDVLKEYAREVLRNQPADILEWSAAYFRALALETDPLQAKQPPADHYQPVVEDADRAMLSNKMVKVFSSMDTAGDGKLPAAEVRRALSEGFDLTQQQALYMITAPFTEVDITGGPAAALIDYNAFAYAAVRTAQYLQQHHTDFTVDTSVDATVHGLSRSEAEPAFTRIFRLLDEAGTGLLGFHDFKSALENAPYHLTQRDIRVLCLECTTSGDDNEEAEVAYEEELPLVFDRLQLAEAFTLFEEEGH